MSNKKSFTFTLTGLVISNEKMEIGNLTISNDSDKDIADQVTHTHYEESHHYTGESEAAAAKGRVEEKKLDLETLVKLAPMGLTLAQTLFKAVTEGNTLRHQQRLEEMQEADRLEAARHARIQAAKGQPTVEQIVKAISESNGELVAEMVKKVRGY